MPSPEHLHRAGACDGAAIGVVRGVDRAQAASENLVVVDRAPAGAVQGDRCADPLRTDAGRHAADGVQCRSAEDRASAVPVGSIEAVPSRPLHALEQVLLGEALAASGHVLEGVLVVVVVGGLDQRYSGIVEVRQGATDEVPVGDLVGGQHHDELGVQRGQDGVELRRHAAVTAYARAVVDAELVAHAGEPWSMSVVEHDDLGREAHAGRGGEGRHEHLVRLVCRRDEHGDGGASSPSPRGERGSCRRSTW